MTQAYLIFYGEDEHGFLFLLGTKNWLNGFWQGKAGPPSCPNNAGQWAPFGGRIETGSGLGAAKATVVKEFQEESGLKFPVDPAGAAFETLIEPHDTSNFYALLLKLERETLKQVCLALHETVAQASGRTSPPGKDVVDWEFEGQRFCQVPPGELDLGIRVDVPVEWYGYSGGEIEAALKKTKPYSQDIDWYWEINQAIKERFGA
ncbi:hypothetical protein [Consotaella aegiceratis]|uniref:hypothetical protein n=1 Tax=Consotaella aegiceratis TaxID=3097961 RepID=UPI002F42B39D